MAPFDDLKNEFFLFLQVNIIPVIAKADTLTPNEVVHFKRQIMNQIIQANILIYDFPEEDLGTNEIYEEQKDNLKIKEHIPFAIVGSNYLIENDGKKVRGRKYPWGIVDVSYKIVRVVWYHLCRIPIWHKLYHF